MGLTNWFNQLHHLLTFTSRQTIGRHSIGVEDLGLAKYNGLFKDSNFLVELEAIRRDQGQLGLVHKGEQEGES